MIKLGCMSLSYNDAFNAKQMNLESFLERAYDLRVDSVEIHFSHFVSTDDAYLRQIRRTCHQTGIDIGYLGVSNNFGKRGHDLSQDIALTKHWTDVAHRMGVPMVRIFAAWLNEDEPEQAVWDRMFDSMREVVDYAAERDVVLGLHNHNHGCVTRTGADVVRILDTIDSPYLSHILDTGQYIGSPGSSGEGTEEPAKDQLYESIATSAPRAVFVRAKFYRVSSGEERWLDYPRILDILKPVGFNGTMSVVYEGWSDEPSDTAVPKAVKYLRRLLAEKGM